MSTCEPIQGDPDFYGRGIRIGVYLQWTSAWLTLLLDPESAQGVLDANSVFVFAVTIATIIASRREAAQIEIYIMLQMLLGFHITTLSSFGIRIWLMTPGRVAKLLRRAAKEWKKDRQKARENQEGIMRDRQRAVDQIAQSVANYPGLAKWILAVLNRFSTVSRSGSHSASSATASVAILPVHLLSALKFPGLTWSGVVWRTMTLGIIAGFNFAYWYEFPNSAATSKLLSDPPDICGPPTVFLFSKQLLQGPIVTLGYAVAIILLLVVGPPIYTLLILTVQIHYYGVLLLFRDVAYWVRPRTGERYSAAIDRINEVLRTSALPVMEAVQFYSPLFPAGMVAVEALKSSLDFLHFMTTEPTGDAIRFTDLLKVFVSLGMGKPSVRAAQEGEPVLSRADTTRGGWEPTGVAGSFLVRATTVLFNIYTFLSIAWFIISIELAIKWNNIEGVDSIDSTGQLIPFIIGCVSASQILKKIILLALSKKYPEWVDVQLNVEIGVNGPVVLGIDKPSGGGNPAAAPFNTRAPDQDQGRAIWFRDT
ncbi:hypothetical protein B0T24DRAFT_145958 [Lasiosphaeria ovina]|uniref:Uncharacterized protein n=1 Tax=Lasiosphaeria ovina TaxID=92902 RepID=A0AAE0NCY4_9PEZI|nr:hypothetical protein B0T24DRAFT_145958 [Lasiosphaeria ovina]